MSSNRTYCISSAQLDYDDWNRCMNDRCKAHVSNCITSCTLESYRRPSCGFYTADDLVFESRGDDE